MRTLLLLSGGIDSPVAGRLLQETGHEVAGVHFGQTPFTDDSPERKSVQAARQLGIDPLWVVDAGEPFAEIARTCRHNLYYVLTKRFMLAAAGRLAQREGFAALATGENLGQVSSQTLANLGCIHHDPPLPVLTPLLGLDKVEIVDLAKAFGTYEMSVGPEMCDALGPDRPATRARIEQVTAEEAKLDLTAMVHRALSAARATLREPAPEPSG